MVEVNRNISPKNNQSSSPTVSLYVLMGSYVMDIMECQYSGVFLQGDQPQDEYPGYIMFNGLMVGMICELDPSCRDKVQLSYKDGKKQMLMLDQQKLFMELPLWPLYSTIINNIEYQYIYIIKIPHKSLQIYLS